MRKSSVFGLIFLLLPGTFVAFARESREMGMTETLVLKISDPIDVDGLLDEPEWKKAPEANSLMQFQTRREISDPFRTSVKILYDDEFIYFGFFCYDRQPDRIEAYARSKDDDIRDDDSVYVLVDTAHDRDNFYYFGTNINGIRFDGKVSLDGRTAEPGWDGAWTVAARKTTFGWTAEMAIDLSCLNYQPGKEKTLGISLSRIVPRNLESFFWSGPLDPAFKITQLDQMQRVELGKSARRLSLSSHAISTSEEGEKMMLGGGVDVRYAFSPSLAAQLTVYPDFSTVEPDKEVINLTRFELFLPEKRDFFLQDSDQYDQKIRLFYSKRITDIHGGVRLHGKAGGLEFSGLSVQARADVFTNENSANYSVFRVKKGLFGSSFVGFLAANKHIDGMNDGVAGIDASLRPGEAFRISGQLAVSYGDHDQDNIAFYVCPSYDSQSLHFHLGYAHLQENFGDNINQVGFVQDDNRRELDSGLGIAFLRNRGQLEQAKFVSNANVYWGMDGTLRSWQVDQGLIFDFTSKFSLTAHHTQEFKASDGLLFEDDFRNHRTELGIGFDTREWELALFSFSFGRNFERTFTMLEIKKNLQVTRSFAVEFDLARIYFEIGHTSQNDFVHSLRAVKSFNENLFVKVFYQVHALIDKINVELQLNYRFLPPAGWLVLGCQIGRARFGETGTQGNTFFLKVGYAF